MTDDWTQRVGSIMLPGEVLEDEVPPPAPKPRKRRKKRTPPSNVEAQQRALGVPADGIAGPMTQKALAAAYAEQRVVIVKNRTRHYMALPGIQSPLSPFGTLDIVLADVDALRDPRWMVLIKGEVIQVYVAELPPKDGNVTVAYSSEEEFFDYLDGEAID